jgi:uncharacterized membrane protein YhhN
MSKELLKSKWLYGLLAIPVVSAILALRYHDFGYKAGVAGSGILILLVLYFRQLKHAKDVWAIIVAFLFSIGGDWFLSNRHGNTGMFIAGIVLFFLAHAGYLSFALLNGRVNWIFTIILLTGYLGFFCLKLYPSIEDKMLLLAVIGYLLISCFSLGAAAGIQSGPVVKGIYIFGIAMILFSDTIIALREFAGYRPLNFLILPTYYLAQICVAFAVSARNIKFNRPLYF